MTLQDKLKEAGFKPEASTEGEWQPYSGTYRCIWKTLRPDFDEKNQASYIQAEWEIEESLSGDAKRESKYPAFRKRYYVDWDEPGDNHLKNAKALANAVFTSTGKEMDFSGKAEFAKSAEGVVGEDVYIRAWAWVPEKDTKGNVIPEDDRKPIQQFSIIKKSVGEKKRSSESVAF